MPATWVKVAVSCVSMFSMMCLLSGWNSSPQRRLRDVSARNVSDVVQVAVAADSRNLDLLVTQLAAIRRASPNIFVNIITTSEYLNKCASLAELPGEYPARAHCHVWDDSAVARVRSQIRVVAGAKGEAGMESKACSGLEGCSTARAQRLSNVFNFARFFLADILPELDFVFWLDGDVIVREPMDSVWDALTQNSSSLLSAFPEEARFGRFYINTDALTSFIASRPVNCVIDWEGRSFNDGVIGINLRRWRNSGVRNHLTWLMSEHRRRPAGLWKYGTQPLMMLIGAEYGWQPLDSSLYYGDLGFLLAEPDRVGRAVFLHFDGEKKPWKPDGLNRQYWQANLGQHRPCQELFRNVLLIAVLFAVVGVVVLRTVGRRKGLSSLEELTETARSLNVFYVFQDNVCYALVIPQSLNIALRTASLCSGSSLMTPAVFSGCFVGVYKFGDGVGMATVWFAMRKHPNLWRNSAHRVIRVALALQVASALMCSGLLLELVSGNASVSSMPTIYLQIIFMLVRFGHGFGAGLVQSLAKHHAVRLSVPSARPKQIMRIVTGITLGLGAGPMIASMAELLAGSAPCFGSLSDFGPMAIALPLLPLLALLSSVLYPNIEHVSETPAHETSLQIYETAKVDDTGQCQRVVIGVLLVSTFRSFSVSALEVGTSMILDVRYHWGTASVGWVIGCCFLCSYFLSKANEQVAAHVEIATRLRGMFTIMLVSLITMLLNGTASRLLLADYFLFPCLYLSDGLMQGIMVQHVLPNNLSCLSMNNVMLLSGLGMVLGRTLSPPIARWHISNGGQRQYAIHQIAFVLLAVVAQEWVLRSRAKVQRA